MAVGRHANLWIAAALVVLLASVFFSLGLGSTRVGLDDAAGALWRACGFGAEDGAPGASVDAEVVGRGAGPLPADRIVLQIRLPRTLLAVLVGALLALSGLIMQAFFRNVMAEPYLVGVSSGAALGAVLAMLSGWSFRLGWFSTVPLAAFLFALGTVLLVYLINRRRSGLHAGGLLLSGIAIASAASAIVALLLVTSERSIQQVLFWLLGSLGAARWEHVGIIAPYAVVGLGVTLLLARDLDLLLWGDVTGAALGVHVVRSRTLLLAAASLMAAACVAVSGVIGFVGLMVPHIGRTLVGSSHRRLIPASMLLGGFLLLWADVLARTLRAPTELPLGAITAIVGAPFLVYLCTLSGRRSWLS
ncbi:MAG: iron ABC transporter permease [Candidatus Eisenbacteria bacterium]